MTTIRLHRCAAIVGSAIGLFGSKQDLGNLDNLLGTEGNENQAIPTNSFPVLPFPLFPLQRRNITLEGIFPSVTNKDYRKNTRDIAEDQVVLAGLRLAKLVNKTLK